MPELPARFDTFYHEFWPKSWTADDWLNGSFWSNMEHYFHHRIVSTAIFDTHHDTKLFKTRHDSLFFAELAAYDWPQFLKQRIIASYVKLGLDQLNLAAYQNNERFLQAELADSPLWPLLQATYERTRQLIAAPQLAQGAIRYALDDTPAEAVLDSILGQHRGQVVYLDIWATWCGPCLYEMPASRRLQQELADEPIAFVYVCIHSERETYEPMLAKYNLGGSHYFLDRAKSSDLIKTLEAKAIPHYAIYDRAGNLVQNKAPGPSEGAIKAKLLELTQ